MLKYIPALTGLRAIAAWMVFIHHAEPFRHDNFVWLHAISQEFYAGVSIFFVLSGFLIYWRYGDDILTTGIHYRSYLQNRFARIFPLYVLVTTVAMGVLWWIGKFPLVPQNLLIYLMNITLLKGFFSEWIFTGLAQGWSLTVEECFYVFAPWLFIAWKRCSLIVPVTITLAGIAIVLMSSTIDFHGFFSDFRFMMVYTFLGRCFEFFCGIAAARYVKANPEAVKFRFCTLVGSAGIMAVLLAMTVLKGSEEFAIDSWTGIVLNNYVLGFIVAMLIVGLAREKTLLQSLLSTRLFELLGRSSYAFYLLHAGMFYAAIWQMVSGNIPAVFLSINVIAILAHYLIERPANLLLRAPRNDG